MTRGRKATTPTALPAAGWLDILARMFGKIGTLNIGLIAAGIAFYGLLSIFPAITAGVALVGLVFDPAALLDRAQWLLAAVPPSAASLITNQLSEVAGAQEGSLSLAAGFSLVVALWSASNATASMVQGLTVIYEEEESRGFIHLKLITIAMTVLLMTGLAVSLVIVAAIPTALKFLGGAPIWEEAALLLRWPVMFFIGVIGLAALFRYGPDRRHARWRWVTPGAVLACGLWVAGTYGFSFYVQTFDSYNETFGTLAGVIILLTWFWLSSFVVLLGALLDAEMEAQTAKDSTVGPDRPMGERGATKADTLGPRRGQAPAEPDAAD